MIHQGDLTIHDTGNTARYAAVTEVTGGLTIREGTTLPALTTVGGGLRISADAALPALTTVGRHLHIHADAALPALTTVGEDLYIRVDTALPALTTVGGGLAIRPGTTMPALCVAHGVGGRLLCVSGYGLWLGDNGLLYAGCRKGLTVAQALDHWDRQDERAIKFTAAIKALQLKETK